VTASVRVTVVALATLVCGLLGLGLSLLTSPFNADPNTTSGGYFFLYLAAAVAVLTVATVRGSFRAWLAVCVVSALIVLVPAAFWLSELVESLSDTPDGLIEFTASATITSEPSPTFLLGEFSPYVVFIGAACATVFLLLPSTSADLRRRRAGG
jgi:4-amino-4-deoxy-L-arabinose transferase-like glycosyltransferase